MRKIEEIVDNEEKRCILCNKAYEHYYNMFGRGCLTNLYDQLQIPNSRYISNKESHFCNTIALRNLKFFLNKEKKNALTQNYIALNYVNKMKLDSLKDIKSKLEENIKSISAFRKYIKTMLPEFSLNDFYKVYNDYMDFKEALDNYNNSKVQDKDEYFDASILKAFSTIFDLGKITMPLYYATFYGLQTAFWKTVVLGGLLADMKLSAYLMNISLNNLGEYKEKGNDLIIDDDYVTKILFENDEFKRKINELLVDESVDIKNNDLNFVEGDLFLALHSVNISVNGNKNNDDSWNLEIQIKDRYDFTDLKTLEEYVNMSDSIPKSLFSTTLNNFAAISSEYGVIKPYHFIIKVRKENYVIE